MADPEPTPVRRVWNTDGSKSYEFLELTPEQTSWIAEQVAGWTRQEWREWFLSLSRDDAEWWERAAASHPALFEGPTAEQLELRQGGLGLDCVGAREVCFIYSV